MICRAKPIFKWAGSKKKMFEKYNPYFEHIKKNKSPKTFVDYFGGTGIMSVWIHQNFDDCEIIINEFNSQIVGIYNAIKYDYQIFLEEVKKYDDEYMAMPHLHDDSLTKENIDNSERKKYYLKIREEYASIENIATKELNTHEAAMLYFMMVNNFNGIWQARKLDASYFSPFGNGWRKNSLLFEYKEALDDFHAMIQNATIVCGSFEKLEVPITKNTVHYFDPPYVNSYTRYSDAFNINHTRIMIDIMENINNSGGIVLMSNKSNSDLFDFSDSFNIEKFDVSYSVSKRKSKAVEILVHNIKKRRGAPYKFKNVKLTTVEQDKIKIIRSKYGSELVNNYISIHGFDKALEHYSILSNIKREGDKLVSARIKAIKIICLRAGMTDLLNMTIEKIGKDAVCQLCDGLRGKAVVSKLQKSYLSDDIQLLQ